MRVAIALLAILFLVGCGADPLAQDNGQPATGRLEVNDGLRAACPMYTDAEIRAYLLAAESDRLAGIDYSTEFQDCLLVCQYAIYPGPCATCMASILAQVYGL